MQVKTKLFEIRDRMTMIAVAAIRMVPKEQDEQELYHLPKAGFPKQEDRIVKDNGDWTYLLNIDTGTASVHPHSWGGRTMPVAHEFIAKNFNKLWTGDVIDVEFLRGEVEFPKAPERLEINGYSNQEAFENIKSITNTAFLHNPPELPEPDKPSFYNFTMQDDRLSWISIRDDIPADTMTLLSFTNCSPPACMADPGFFILTPPAYVMIAFYRRFANLEQTRWRRRPLNLHAVTD